MDPFQNNMNGNSFTEESTFNFREILLKSVRLWPLFLISIIACLFLSYLYLRYSTPKYNVSAKVLINNDQNTASSPQNMLNDISLFNMNANVENENIVLQTRYLMRKVAEELNLNVQYFLTGNIKSTELYKHLPFQFKVIALKDSIPAQTIRLQFSKQAGKKDFKIITDSTSNSYSYGDTIVTDNMTFTVIPVTAQSNRDDYTIVVNTIKNTTSKYSGLLKSEIITKNGDVIQLNLTETVPGRGEDVLNKLYEVYTRVNQEDKNRIADSTIRFIDDRLDIVSAELSGVEQNIEQFKTNNNISLDLEEQAKQSLSTASDIQKQLIQQEVQIGVVDALETYIRNNPGKIVPNAADLTDPTYISTVEKYNDLVLERDRQLQTTKPDNPLILNYNTQIASLQRGLISSLENIKKGMALAKNSLEEQNNRFSRNLHTAPTKERTFIDISRQQQVKQQLYLYLLQKREETAVSKAGTLANSRLIEPAQTDPAPVSPKRGLTYVLGLLAGLLIPASVIYIKDLFNNRISERNDITSVTSVPIIGEIGHNNTNDIIVAKQDSRTGLSEQFRAVRTNLQFFLTGNNSNDKVIMITSSMGGEGKSFSSMNIASALAITGKKVVMMEMDLRKPKLSKELNMPNTEGFTSYMLGQTGKEQLAKQTNVHPNLYLVGSGPIPPNPAELILQDKVAELFQYLRSQFDYVIVDTPPSGLVSDALLIAKYVDFCIYIVRLHFTLKPQLNIVKDLYTNKKVPNLSILVNDVKTGGRYGYSYSYGYGYGYGYGNNNNGYYAEDKPARSKRRFL